jgi:hypothetical protein
MLLIFVIVLLKMNLRFSVILVAVFSACIHEGAEDAGVSTFCEVHVDNYVERESLLFPTSSTSLQQD